MSKSTPPDDDSWEGDASRISGDSPNHNGPSKPYRPSPESKRLQFLHDRHMQMFKHSDNYLQHLTEQFSVFSTILFGVFGITFSQYADNDALSVPMLMVCSIIIFMGLASSYVWSLSYARSRKYRNLHHEALEWLETRLGVRYGEPLTPCTETLFWHGAAQARELVMYGGILTPKMEADRIKKEMTREEYIKRATKQSIFSTERITTLVAILWGFFLAALVLSTALFILNAPG